MVKKKRKNNKRPASKFPLWVLIPLILVALIYVIGEYNKNRHHIFPISLSRIESQAQVDADILVIGDTNSLLFNSHIENLVNDISKNLNRPVTVFNLGERNENIFRTFFKLKQIKKLPPVIIYMGGSSEFYERLIPKNIEITSLNYTLFKNEFFRALYTLMPSLRKYIFIPDKKVELSPQPEKGQINSDEIKKYLEIYFHSFEIEIKRMISYIERNNSTPFLVTPPLNLLASNNKACEGSFNEDTNRKLIDIKESLERGMTKEALFSIKELDAITYSNAEVKSVYGQALYEVGSYTKAKAQLTLAKAYNCSPSGTHPVINSIIKKVAKARDTYFYDFSNHINLYFGKNELFLNDSEAQVIYYEKLQKELIIRLKDIFSL